MSASRTERLRHVAHRLRELHRDLLRVEGQFGRDIRRVPPEHQASARNLAHYLGLRQHDMRPLQDELTALGLSSLGRCEGHTLAALETVLALLARLGVEEANVASAGAPSLVRQATFSSGARLLERNTVRLFGRAPEERRTRIMVTMPSQAARDPEVAEELLRAGMDVARINCAHDDVVAWAAMVGHLRRAERRTGRRCRVLVDLAGPKLRTGPLPTEPALLKLKPKRDAQGKTIAPVRVWLTPEAAPEPAPDAMVVLPLAGLPGAWPPAAGTALALTDIRGRSRELIVERVAGASVVATLERAAWVEPGTKLRVHLHHGRKATVRVGAFAGRPGSLLLCPGDHLVLTRELVEGVPARQDEAGHLQPARIACTLPEAFRDVRVGDPIWLDDGAIGAVVVANDGRDMLIEVRQAPQAGARLRADKGINLPDSDLRLSGLTAKDREDLVFAREHADLVGLSFVQRPEDVGAVARALDGRGGRGIGIILKIETRRGFEALPRLLMAGLRHAPVGVMVARGDLAVEVGFERLAEVQEEILWLCEAAHVPVIWATQVLESLAKTGAPSRAEVTDAAMSVRAECVMLNKGPFVARAVEFLDDVLRRMHAHQDKKRTMLRRLSVAEG